MYMYIDIRGYDGAASSSVQRQICTVTRERCKIRLQLVDKKREKRIMRQILSLLFNDEESTLFQKYKQLCICIQGISEIFQQTLGILHTKKKKKCYINIYLIYEL